VTENFGNIPEMGALLEHSTRQRVAEQVRRDAVGPMDTRVRHSSTDNMADACWPAQCNSRSIGTQKDTPGSGSNTSIQAQIGGQGPPDVLRYRQQIPSLPFTPDQNLACSPTDVPQLEKQDLARPKTQLRQQEQDGEIASPSTAGSIRCR
jgi:hypothetical protein